MQKKHITFKLCQVIVSFFCIVSIGHASFLKDEKHSKNTFKRALIHPKGSCIVIEDRFSLQIAGTTTGKPYKHGVFKGQFKYYDFDPEGRYFACLGVSNQTTSGLWQVEREQEALKLCIDHINTTNVISHSFKSQNYASNRQKTEFILWYGYSSGAIRKWIYDFSQQKASFLEEEENKKDDVLGIKSILDTSLNHHYILFYNTMESNITVISCLAKNILVINKIHPPDQHAFKLSHTSKYLIYTGSYENSRYVALYSLQKKYNVHITKDQCNLLQNYPLGHIIDLKDGPKENVFFILTKTKQTYTLRLWDIKRKQAVAPLFSFKEKNERLTLITKAFTSYFVLLWPSNLFVYRYPSYDATLFIDKLAQKYLPKKKALPRELTRLIQQYGELYFFSPAQKLWEMQVQYI